MRAQTVAAGVLLLLAGSTQADIVTPSHSCSEPSKPYEFTSEWEVQQFRSDVEEYKECISDFVEDQEDEIRNHQQAAQDAIDDWNNFVDSELR